jgi:hypothetical protein
LHRVEELLSEATMENETFRHILVVHFRDGTSEEKIQSLFTAFRDMIRKIERVVGFEYGFNSPQS